MEEYLVDVGGDGVEWESVADWGGGCGGGGVSVDLRVGEDQAEYCAD